MELSRHPRWRRPALIIAGTALVAAVFTQVGAAAATGTPNTGTSPSPSPTKPSPSPTKPPNHPPVCSAVTVSPDSLWPPNHKFVAVTLTGATDPDGDKTTLTITGVTQDEPLDGLGDGDTAPDAAVVAGRTDQVQLRAERSGTGDGRVYRISFTVSDGKDRCTGTVYVGVPHDQSGDPAVDTKSVVVNSFG
ncbi:hypothetical protein [Phytohabitans aurantiacus]|uniref:hypothetical protein n=1 Tax=Phytohabitans aurantiacus TaxID=3016789 RepID=UPI0024937987|nr:hypothetical protein [Phytohabitans aurantiacus]